MHTNDEILCEWINCEIPRWCSHLHRVGFVESEKGKEGRGEGPASRIKAENLRSACGCGQISEVDVATWIKRTT